jgi:pimeloyl-ACP methyl ester carboxylesterase
MPASAFTIARYVAVALIVVYLVALAALYLLQERLIFAGDPLPADHVFRFEQRFEELRIAVPGATLDALHFMQEKPRGLVFFVHGNAGNLETWTTNVEFYRQVNFDLFIFDFRGYGKSTGRIGSEAQLEADVRAAYDAIAPRYAGVPIVIYGRSLGTALATRLAADTDPALLVLVTPYTSLADIARRLYPWAPSLLLKYPLRTDAAIGSVRAPILLIHGTQDALIPFDQSTRLLALARAPAELLTVEGASHNDVHEFPLYLRTLEARLRDLAGPRP